MLASSINVHKRNLRSATPQVSLILLDWSVRESFHALDWISQQTVPRDQYEIIWVDLYHRVVPAVMEKADVVITCGQHGLYHKHVGYNVGLLNARGQIVTVCDSDAVFPPNFIDSIINTFQSDRTDEPTSIVLMHYEKRTKETYPKDLSDVNQLHSYQWMDLWPNVGACVSIRKLDAVRFGGFDEHRSFRGYFCGPYELAWRLVNAGFPEIWHDESVCLFHFAHPHSNEWKNRDGWYEIACLHVDCHAIAAVEGFSKGRLLPLKENPEIHQLRMRQRRIGTRFEEKYAWMSLPSRSKKFSRHLRL